MLKNCYKGHAKAQYRHNVRGDNCLTLMRQRGSLTFWVVPGFECEQFLRFVGETEDMYLISQHGDQPGGKNVRLYNYTLH